MRLLGLLFALCISLIGNAQNFIDKRNDLLKKELKGSVKSVKTYELRKLDFLSDEELNDFRKRGKKPPYYKKEWSNTLDFNSAGYIVKSSCPESWTGENYTMTYRKDNQPLTMTKYLDDGSVNNTYVFTYDGHGLINYAERKGTDGLIFQEYYTCNQSGHLVQLKHINKDGSITINNFEYIDGKLSKWTIIKNGKTQQTMFFDGGIDRLKEVIVINGQQENHIRVLLNQKGLPEKVEREISTGNWIVITQRTFDANNNLIKEVNYKQDGTIGNQKVISYKYDQHGNWISRVSKGNGRYDNKTEERELIYY